MGAEIENQITKRTMMYFSYQERAKKKKKKTTSSDNLTTTRLHTPHHVKEKIVAHPMRQ